MAGFEPSLYAQNYALSLEGHVPYATNVVRRVISAVKSEFAQNTPRPRFLTSGGDYAAQQKAKKLTKFTEGCFAESRADAEMKMVGVDACIFGTGAAKIFEEAGRARLERTFIGSLFVDEQDAFNGKPRSLYQRVWVDRGVLGELYPEHKEIIEAAQGVENATGSDRNTSDQICVVEAWHLPSRPHNATTDEAASTDGRHVICIESDTLFDEDWKDDSFPFVFVHWEPPVLGFWGTGIAEMLVGIQYSLNELEEHVREGLAFAALRVFIERGSKIVPGHLEAWDGSCVEYTGRPPVFNTDPTVGKQIFDEIQRRTQMAFEEIGVSQMSASGMKPAGLDSGEAQRVFNDNISKRFIDFAQGYEAAHVEAAKQMVNLVRRLAENDNAYEVVYRTKSHIERIKFSETDLSRDAYVVDVFPASMLPNTPAGKLSTIQDMIQSGMAAELGLDAQTLVKLLGFPDIEGEALSSARELADRDIASILDDGVYYSPEAFMDLAVCIRVGIARYCEARIQNVPESKLELLRQYIETSIGLQAKAVPAAEPMAPAGAPGAPPSAPAMPIAA